MHFKLPFDSRMEICVCRMTPRKSFALSAVHCYPSQTCLWLDG